MNIDALMNGRKEFYFKRASRISAQYDVEDVAGNKLFRVMRETYPGRFWSSGCLGFIVAGMVAFVWGLFCSILFTNTTLVSLSAVALFFLLYFTISLAGYKPKRISVFDYETKSKQVLEIQELTKIGFPKARYRIYRKGRSICHAEKGWHWKFKDNDGTIICVSERLSLLETAGFFEAITKTGLPKLAFYNQDEHKVPYGFFEKKRNWNERTIANFSKDYNNKIDPWIGLGIGVLINEIEGKIPPPSAGGGGL